ncbi:hypothetical protein BKA70DRAFT_683988 [Coprinopsis sp. MPI-PUGE-AT-0042]|nr:hypothetical protein BKA70DRAFT_683988 [Coprinopsis sp. MPI-PUGE-AT-0042]
MVTAGLIPLFISMLSDIDWKKDARDALDAFNIAQHLSRLGAIPANGPGLTPCFLSPEYKFPSVFGGGGGGSIVALLWSCLLQGMALTNRILSDPPGNVIICDSCLHQQTTVLPYENSFKRAQCCSGCHLVVYCSQACQREDWDERHKSECKSMKQTYDDRRRDAVHYSHANRHLHIQMVTVLLRTPNMSTLNKHDCSSVNEAILVIDASRGLDRPQVIEEIPSSDFPSMFLGKFDSPEMEARKEGVIKDFSARRSSTTKTLLALVLSWDIHHRVHVLVEAGPDESNRFAVTRSVVSIEDTRSSKYQYRNPLEIAMINILKEQQGLQTKEL